MAKKLYENDPKNYDPKTTFMIVNHLLELAKSVESAPRFSMEVGAYCQKLLDQVVEPDMKKIKKVILKVRKRAKGKRGV